MSIRIGKEVDICNKILKGTETLFVVRFSKIARFVIGGTSECPRFLTYDNRFEKNYEDDYIVLEVKNDGECYYFEPIFSDDKILIYSEDYMYGDYLDAPLGEIKTSNNRQQNALRRSYTNFYGGLDTSYVFDMCDCVMENPLAVQLVDLISFNDLHSDRVISYNEVFGNELARKLSLMKLRAIEDLADDYERTSKLCGKKFLKENMSSR